MTNEAVMESEPRCSSDVSELEWAIIRNATKTQWTNEIYHLKITCTGCDL